MKAPLTYLAILILSILPVHYDAQTITDSLIHEMYSLWSGAYTLYEVDHMSGSIESTKEYFELSDSVYLTDDFRERILKAESDLVNKDWGLDWSAGYLYNTSAGMDVADNILYKSRLQTQVSWSLLNNGFLENKTKSKILSNKSEIVSFGETDQFLTNGDILENWYKVIYRFNLSKIEVLNQRLSLAEKRVSISYQLKSLGKITHEELLNNLESYAEISSLYKIYEEYNLNLEEDMDGLSTEALPLIDIDYSYALEQIEMGISDSSKQLMLENLDLENKFYNNVDLKIYSRYNYYDLINNPVDNRWFLTLGVGVGIPLNFQKKEKEELYELKKQQILHGQIQEDENQFRLKNDLLSYLYEFRYKLKQFNAFYYKKLKMEELLRKEQARFDVNRLDFNPLKALRWLDELMSIDVELIDLKQQMYLYVLRMLSIAPNMDVQKLIVQLELDELEIEKVKKEATEVYVWSKTLTNYDIETLVNYCVMNRHSKVVVSASGDKDKFNDFAAKCKASGIVVEAMIGNNHLIENYSEEKLATTFDGIDWQNVDAIHLDVEPQTFADWKERKAFYVSEYLKMFKGVSNWCNTKALKVSVSLPTYFPEEAVVEIQQMGGTVYFMCYENVTTSFLQKKLEKYKGTEFVIALRPEDFSNMVEVETKMTELKMLLNPDRFIIHDLERLLKFAP